MKKKKPILQVDKKLLLLLTVIIFAVGIFMIFFSILLAPDVERFPSSVEQTPEIVQPVDEKKKESSPKPTTPVLEKTLETPKEEELLPQKEVPTTPSVTKPEKIIEKPSSGLIFPELTSGQKPGVLLFVFDDAGHNIRQLQPFLNLPFPVTIAVLPGLENSKTCADLIRQSGKELFLHQPMQAINLDVNPGPGAITPDMRSGDIVKLLRKNLKEIGPVKGMNNHEGSLITADVYAMGVILDVCIDEKIVFLDSRTNSESKARQAALERDLTIMERDVFLDNTQNRDDIVEMINRGLGIASKKGHAIMIGHVWSEDLAQILMELYPELVKKGYSFETISRMTNSIRD